MHGWMDGQMDGWMEELTERFKGSETHGRTEGQTKIQMLGLMDGRTDPWMTMLSDFQTNFEQERADDKTKEYADKQKMGQKSIRTNRQTDKPTND